MDRRCFEFGYTSVILFAHAEDRKSGLVPRKLLRVHVLLPQLLTVCCCPRAALTVPFDLMITPSSDTVAEEKQESWQTPPKVLWKRPLCSFRAC
jgi:hypothetical protein